MQKTGQCATSDDRRRHLTTRTGIIATPGGQSRLQQLEAWPASIRHLILRMVLSATPGVGTTESGHGLPVMPLPPAPFFANWHSCVTNDVNSRAAVLYYGLYNNQRRASGLR